MDSIKRLAFVWTIRQRLLRGDGRTSSVQLRLELPFLPLPHPEGAQAPIPPQTFRPSRAWARLPVKRGAGWRLAGASCSEVGDGPGEGKRMLLVMGRRWRRMTDVSAAENCWRKTGSEGERGCA